MSELTVMTARELDFIDPIVDQVALDLSKYLNQYTNRSYGIRFVSKESGLHEKTIKRLLEKKNKATYQTVAKLYFIFLGTEDYTEVLKNCAPVIRDFLESQTPSVAVPKTSQKSESFAAFLKQDPLVAEIFVLAGTGPIELQQIRYLYGQYGVEALEKLIDEKVILEFAKDQFRLSPQTPSLNGDSLKFLGEHFTRRFCKPRDVMSENNISFYAEGLNAEGLKAWLAIDHESFYKKLKIAEDKKYLGPQRIFTFCVTDSISQEEK